MAGQMSLEFGDVADAVLQADDYSISRSVTRDDRCHRRGIGALDRDKHMTRIGKCDGRIVRDLDRVGRDGRPDTLEARQRQSVDRDFVADPRPRQQRDAASRRCQQAADETADASRARHRDRPLIGHPIPSTAPPRSGMMRAACSIALQRRQRNAMSCGAGRPAHRRIQMGLLDILNGMQNGPRGSSDPNDKSGGMSPMTMAILALLAYKGYKHLSGNQAGQGQAMPAPQPGGTTTAQTGGGGLGGGLGGMLGGLLGGGAQGSGGLGGLLKGPLGGLLAGGAAGSILSGGLGDLVKQLQQGGQGEAANSWVGSGPNKQIAPNDLANALGADQIDHLTSQTGMSRDELLSGLSQQLPEVVNQLTPHGRLPTEQEASNWV